MSYWDVSNTRQSRGGWLPGSSAAAASAKKAATPSSSCANDSAASQLADRLEGDVPDGGGEAVSVVGVAAGGGAVFEGGGMVGSTSDRSPVLLTHRSDSS